MSGTVHIVGAGLAGLSTAVHLTGRGVPVALYEAAPHAGGRCRTFWDPRLERHVDNGNHLLLSGNRSARAYLEAIGAGDRMRMASAAYPFADLADGSRWTVRLNEGPVPWWIAAPGRRVPGTGLFDYLRAAGLALARPGRTVADTIRGRGPLWRRFWEPLTLAALNTTPERGAAPLLWRVLRETFARGAAHARPMFAPEGLGTALVDPAVAWLMAHGVALRTGAALKAIDREGGRASVLRFGDGEVRLGPDDRVVLALPPTRLRAAMPEIDAPADDAGIVNAHFTVADLPAGLPPFIGLVGARTHWIFVRGDVVSLTISAADRLGEMERDPADLIPALWAEVQTALGLSGPFLAARINKERRATFDQSPAGIARRPRPKTLLANLYLAGDATDTGLPATIEGAIRSGETAARLAA